MKLSIDNHNDSQTSRQSFSTKNSKKPGKTSKLFSLPSNYGLRLAKALETDADPSEGDEFIQAMKAGVGAGNIPVGLIVADEETAEACRLAGAAAIAPCSWGKNGLRQLAESLEKKCPVAVFATLGDSKDFRKAFDEAGLHNVVVDPATICLDFHENGNVKDILAVMEIPDFIRRLEEEIHKGVDAEQKELDAVDTPDSFNPTVEFLQQMRHDLYGDKPWICAKGVMHHWTGNHYEKSIDGVECQRIGFYCNTYAVADREGDTRYPYANPSFINQSLKWVKSLHFVHPNLIDPPGINCTNGVLQISWNNDKPIWELIEHDPSLYYTYEPLATYNPDAEPQHCERMLSALDEPQQDIFLKTIAASLDLATVRKFKGRLVRALLMKGDGSNGKDTLRECVAAMYGYRGMTNATLTDFAAYDKGRKFPLSKLDNCRVNWASENANFDKLDTIQSLKAFITGDPIDIERKGKGEYNTKPAGIAIFNINNTPNLQASLKAIQSRYGILAFDKTFAIGADPNKGEIEADSRFKDNPEFLRSEILPAFLNRVLDALQRLMLEGIDYGCTQQTLEEIQAENSHLFQFCQDTGLQYDPKGVVTGGEIWEQLERWYFDNGTLCYEEGKKKPQWIEQVNRNDRNVKGANQVIQRFKEIFPKTKRASLGGHKAGLRGISFSATDKLVASSNKPISTAYHAATRLTEALDDLSEVDRQEILKVYGLTRINEVATELTHLPHPMPCKLDTVSDTDSLTDSPTDSLLAHPLAHLSEATGSPLPHPIFDRESSPSGEERMEECRNMPIEMEEMEDEPIDEIPQQPQQVDGATGQPESVVTEDEPLKVGDKAWWENCPRHCESWNPFTVTSIDNGYAMIDVYENPVPISDLRRIE